MVLLGMVYCRGQIRLGRAQEGKSLGRVTAKRIDPW